MSDKITDGSQLTALYAAPPAAEQPYSTTSDCYRADLYDQVLSQARLIGFGNVTEALAELQRMRLAEQPDAEKARSDWEENATLLEQERDALRAEVERIKTISDSYYALVVYANANAEVKRLREIREIASQCAANGGYLSSQDLIELRYLLRSTK